MRKAQEHLAGHHVLQSFARRNSLIASIIPIYFHRLNISESTVVSINCPMHPSLDLCIHHSAFVPAIQHLYPSIDLCIRRSTFVPFNRPIYPSIDLCILQSTLESIIRPLYPSIDPCIRETALSKLPREITHVMAQVKLPYPEVASLTSIKHPTS